MTDDAAIFGTRVAACRQSLRLSQQELAELSGLSVRTIRNLERGRIRWPHPNSVLRLADALGLSGQPRAEFVAAAGRRLALESSAPAATVTNGQVVRVGGGWFVPRQLPGTVRQFAGRRAELAVLSTLLDHAGTAAPTAVVISAIGGTAGVGKTALAVHWARQVAARFPDGQLYVDLHGFGPSARPALPSEAIRGLLDALEVPAARIPAGLDAQAALYRSLLSGRRMLVVLDNARDAGQVRPLLPGSPSCLVLVTSRSQLTGLVATEDAHPLTLDLLTEAEARELLVLRLGAARLTAEPGSAAELIRLCARLPLALAIIAARASTRPGLGLGVLVGELKDAQRKLDALDAGDAAASVRAVFSWSVDSLPAPAAHMFSLLGLHPGPDITVPAAAGLAGIPCSQARQALDGLAEVHLISEHTPGRFAMHDLLRVYAAERARDVGEATDQRAAIHRAFDYYLHTAHAANEMLYPGRRSLVLVMPQTGAAPESPADSQQAQTWLRAERRVLLTVIEQAVKLRFDIHGWQIPFCLAMFLDLQGYWDDWAATQRAALISAQHLGDTEGQARVHLISGHACMRLDREREAHSHLRNALRLYRQLEDRVGQASVHVAFSLVLNHQGKHSDAFGHAQQALVLYWSVDDQAGLAQALNALGWSHGHLASPQRAVDCSRLALDLHREAGNTLGEAEAWDSLGHAYYQLGDYGEATACYQRAISGFRELASRHEEARAHTCLGDVHLAYGRPDQARHAWQRALAVLEEENHPSADPVRRRLQHLGNTANNGTSQANEPISPTFSEQILLPAGGRAVTDDHLSLRSMSARRPNSVEPGHSSAPHP